MGSPSAPSPPSPPAKTMVARLAPKVRRGTFIGRGTTIVNVDGLHSSSLLLVEEGSHPRFARQRLPLEGGSGRH